VKEGLADFDRLCIDGGSAGGYTMLAALAFRDVFKAGCSLYGVGDLAALARDTHKFESRYLDGLVGPYPDEERIYRERSPIESVDTLSCPILLLQGDEDKVRSKTLELDFMAQFSYSLRPSLNCSFILDCSSESSRNDAQRCIEEGNPNVSESVQGRAAWLS
jgi:Prolyl oligopeptidase family